MTFSLLQTKHYQVTTYLKTLRAKALEAGYEDLDQNIDGHYGVGV